MTAHRLQMVEGRCHEVEPGKGSGHFQVVPEGWGGSVGLDRAKKAKKRHIYIVAVLPHLESPPLGWVEHQEALEEVLAVGGHVEGDAVLPSEDALPQLLPATTGEPLITIPCRRHFHTGSRSLTLRFCPSNGSEPLTRV